MSIDLDAVFKAYDVRGLVPAQLDAAVARLVGRAFVAEVDAEAVVVGRDMRDSSPELAEAFGAGVRDAGVDVVDIGLASTDQLYFASGHLDLPGAMLTASHNPAAYNGIKLCRARAVALSRDTGLARLRDQVAAWLGAPPPAPGTRGGLAHRDVLDAYADHLLSLVPVRGRRLTVAVDAGNGMAGHTVPAVLGRLDLDVVPLYFELDGTFPNHVANPLDPRTLVDLQVVVRERGADLGLAFDGDADRCFVVDEQGAAVPPSALTALIAVRELAREPGARVIHNLISSRAVPQAIAAHGGVPVRTQVGHSLIKATMAEHDAVFGGEHSGHFYFRDFWFADSGMLAALHLLAALASDDRPVSDLLAAYDPYVASGEVNTSVTGQAERQAEVEAAFAGREGVRSIDHLDGLTVTADRWWFNVRASNTEPLLRLNVEADDRTTMESVRDEVLGLMRSKP